MTLTFRSKTEKGWTVDSPFTAFTFPGGEAHIKIDPIAAEQKFQYQLADLRGADSHELMQLAMWADVCHEREEITVLILPYLPGARSDKGNPLGGFVYAGVLASLGIDQTITLDPHSDLMPGWMSNHRPTVYPVEHMIKRELGNRGDYYDHPYVGVIAPDAGAVGRAQAAADVLHVPLFKAEKKRDFETGKLSGFACEPLPADGKLLLVDDICDGGGTFIGLAEVTGVPRDNLDLWVTHGIFSQGLGRLSKYFDTIHTTDSWAQGGSTSRRMPTGFVKVHKVLPYLTEDIKF